MIAVSDTPAAQLLSLHLLLGAGASTVCDLTRSAALVNKLRPGMRETAVIDLLGGRKDAHAMTKFYRTARACEEAKWRSRKKGCAREAARPPLPEAL